METRFYLAPLLIGLALGCLIGLGIGSHSKMPKHEAPEAECLTWKQNVLQAEPGDATVR